MEDMDIEETALAEHRFWLQIMGDHSRFIRDSLVSEEVKEIQTSDAFVQVFDRLLEQARGDLEEREIWQVTRDARIWTEELKGFKLHLLRRTLEGNLKSHLPPTFFNHMVNELEEYLRILRSMEKGQQLAMPHPLHLHLVWLRDASGHAQSISSGLDMTENRLRELSDTFARQFDEFYLKAVELTGYMRTNLHRFPALSRFNKQVGLEMLVFKEFLRELEEMGLRAELLGTLTPLMADHMAREECYYLNKLALVAQTDPPGCNPSKRRTER